MSSLRLGNERVEQLPTFAKNARPFGFRQSFHERRNDELKGKRFRGEQVNAILKRGHFGILTTARAESMA